MENPLGLAWFDASVCWKGLKLAGNLLFGTLEILSRRCSPVKAHSSVKPLPKMKPKRSPTMKRFPPDPAASASARGCRRSEMILIRHGTESGPSKLIAAVCFGNLQGRKMVSSDSLFKSASAGADRPAHEASKIGPPAGSQSRRGYWFRLRTTPAGAGGTDPELHCSRELRQAPARQPRHPHGGDPGKHEPELRRVKGRAYAACRNEIATKYAPAKTTLSGAGIVRTGLRGFSIALRQRLVI
jgi:hypothetical protein